MLKDDGVEVWVRGRRVNLPASAARKLHANAWVVRVPKDEATGKLLRLREISMDTLVDVGILIGGAEAFQVVASGEDAEGVELTALL